MPRLKIIALPLLLALCCLGATTAYYYNGRLIGAVQNHFSPFTNALFVYTGPHGGNDFNDGFTTNTPMLTVSNAIAHWTNGVACTIYLENGGLFRETNLVIPNIGSASAPFRITTYGPNLATIDINVRGTSPSPPNIWETREPSGINISNANYITLDNFILSGAGASTSNSANGIKILHMDVTGSPNDYSHVVLSNLVVRKWATGMSIWALSNAFGFSNSVVTHCILTNNNWTGMTIRSLDDPVQSPVDYPVLNRIAFHGFTVSDCEIGNQYGFTDNGAVHVPTMIAFRSCEDIVLTRNWIHDTGTLYAQTGVGGAGIQGIQSKRCIASFNYVSNFFATPNPGHKSIDGMGIDLDCQDALIFGNYIVDCDGPGLQSSYSWGNTHYCFNEIHHCGRGSTATEPVFALNFNLNNKDLRIYNNTIDNSRVTLNPAGGFGCQDDFSNVTSGSNIVANNIFYLFACTNVVEVGSNQTNFWFFTNNAYFDGAWGDKLRFRWGGVDYTGLTAWRAVGGDKGGWVTNGPLFMPEVVDPVLTVGNMRLGSTNCYMSTNSPLWKHAANLNGLFGITITNDFAGNALTPSSYSVGAFDTNAEPIQTPFQSVPAGAYAQFLPEEIFTNGINFLISNWKDRSSGNNWTLLAPTSGSTVTGPTIANRSSLCGKLFVRFDGTQFMTNSAFTNLFSQNPLDIFMIIKNSGVYDGTANPDFLLDGYGSSNRVLIVAQNVLGDTTTNFWNVGSGDSLMDSRTGTNFFETVELVVTNGGLAFYTNNVLCLTGVATNAGWYGMTLFGRFGPTAGDFMAGQLACLAIWTNDVRGQYYSTATNRWRGIFP